MFEVEIDGVKYEADVTFYTAYLYEAEFKSDMLQDLLGVQTIDPAVDYELSEGEDGEVDVKITKIDFTQTSWLAVSKALWAALKTADPATAPYSQWMRETAGANLWDLHDVIGKAVEDCFFRAGAAEKEVPEQEG